MTPHVASSFIAGALLFAAGADLALAQARRAAPPPQAPFETSRSVGEMSGKQAVVATSLGEFVIDLLPDAAPNHVGYFMKLAEEGAYDGTTFHRAVRYGIIQGGDPLSRDPDRSAQYGTGGLGVLRREVSDEPTTRGAVAAVLQPGKPDSGGAQFFVCVTDQPALAGHYTVFGRVAEGLEVVERLSAAGTDADGRVVERLVIERVTIRDRPPDPFSTETDAELGAMQAVLETSLGEVGIEFFVDLAPRHVRHFLRLAALGVYEGVAFHRVVPGFVAQTGSIGHRREPLTARQQGFVTTLAPEFSDTPHAKGIVSMARGDDPASASTSFFICLGAAASLDGKYTVFGRVVSGLEVVEAIERVPVDGETPVERVEIMRVRIERRPTSPPGWP